MNYSREIAKISLDTGAIKLNPNNPFLWASGYRMPIYNDNRLLLGNAKHRQIIANGFQSIPRPSGSQDSTVRRKPALANGFHLFPQQCV